MKYITVLIAIVLSLFIWIYTNDRQQYIGTDTMKTLLDSLKVHDIKRDSLIQKIHSKYLRDSLQIAVKREYVDKTPDIVATIKKQYNDKRNHIDSLPVTEQLSFFTEWASKEDTL